MCRVAYILLVWIHTRVHYLELIRTRAIKANLLLQPSNTAPSLWWHVAQSSFLVFKMETCFSSGAWSLLYVMLLTLLFCNYLCCWSFQHCNRFQGILDPNMLPKIGVTGAEHPCFFLSTPFPRKRRIHWWVKIKPFFFPFQLLLVGYLNLKAVDNPNSHFWYCSCQPALNCYCKFCVLPALTCCVSIILCKLVF